MRKEEYVRMWAEIDESRKFRYLLGRQWGPDRKNFVNFILLNPSTADATVDDQTVRKCIGLARLWNFDGLVITNLFAFRATNPRVMLSCRNPHGDRNDTFIKRVAKSARIVVVAWGNNGAHCQRDKEVLEILARITKPYCLGVTASGQPRHPLYLGLRTSFRLYRP